MVLIIVASVLAAVGRRNALAEIFWRDPVPAFRIESEPFAAEPCTRVRLGVDRQIEQHCSWCEVTEITPREALGLPSALLRAGASSMPAAAWSVDISSSRAFLERFHQAWLHDGLSRAAAHRRAALEIRGAFHPWSHPYHWAPFLLTACTLEGDIV